MSFDPVDIGLTVPFAAVGGVVGADMLGVKGLPWKAGLGVLMLLTMAAGEAVLPGKGGSPFTSTAGGGLMVWLCWVVCIGVARSRRIKVHG